MLSTDLAELSLKRIEEIPLEIIALLAAKIPYPNLEYEPYLRLLDRYAARARKHVAGIAGAPAIATALSHYLFEEEDFRGNISDYYNPSNNYFNDVLDHRSGSPLTLSLLYIAVGARLGLPVFGVSFPGHFLVRYKNSGNDFFIDAFQRGKLLSELDCRKRLQEQYGDRLCLQKEFLDPASHRTILLRLLCNLKTAHLLQKEFEKVIQIINYMLLFAPNELAEIKERGLIYLHLECFQPALVDLESYIQQVPDDPDRSALEICLKELRGKVGQIS